MEAEWSFEMFASCHIATQCHKPVKFMTQCWPDVHLQIPLSS